MKHNLKIFIIYFIIFFSLFEINKYLFGYLFPGAEQFLKIAIPGIVTVIICPIINRVKTAKGTRTQLKWLFRKEPLIK